MGGWHVGPDSSTTVAPVSLLPPCTGNGSWAGQFFRVAASAIAPPEDVMARADWFSRFSSQISRQAGRPVVFCLACLAVAAWAGAGPVAGFSERWQLVINTGTTIVTFLMVFIIQNTQTRDTAALQIKLDELIRTSAAANKALLDLEELSQEDIDRYHRLYERMAKKAAAKGVPQPPPARSARG